MIEKVSMIVNNYFKIVTEMDKRNQEVDILIVYNR
jgi:hypothetical protein